MSKNRAPKLVVGIVASFMGLGGVIIFLLATKIVSVPVGIQMLVASVGMHLGFGILLAVYMPYYKKGDACVWDLAVFLLIVTGLWGLSRSRGDTGSPIAPRRG
jgi:hypothetical protein